MTRYKTHLIAINKPGTQDEMVMRDIRDAMKYLAIMVSYHDSSTSLEILATDTPNRRALSHQSPATHIYCYDAQVIPYPQHSAKN